MNLLENEKLNFDSDLDEIKKNSDNEINDKYEDGELRIITEQGRYPLSNILEILAKTIHLDPDYQRRHVWSPEQKSRLIESYIMNVPVPPVFLYEVDYAKYEVMDGLQRLTTLKDFYSDELELTGLQVWPELNGRRLTTLPSQVKKGIDRRYISTIVIVKETTKLDVEAQKLKQFVFERLNSGGTKLKDQEIRNAIYAGRMNNLTKEIAKNNKFVKEFFQSLDDVKDKTNALQLSLIDDFEPNNDNQVLKRMEDVELVLRFFAYRHIDSIPHSNLKDVLDNYLALANCYEQDLLDELSKLFEFTINLAYEIFEDKTFNFYRDYRGCWSWTKPSKIIYDPLMQVLSGFYFKQDQVNNLISNKKHYQDKMKEVMCKYSDNFNARNTNKNDVKRRIELISSELFDINLLSN